MILTFASLVVSPRGGQLAGKWLQRRWPWRGQRAPLRQQRSRTCQVPGQALLWHGRRQRWSRRECGRFPLVKNEVFGKPSIPLHLAASISGSLRASNACSILKEQWGEEAYEANVSWMANDYDSLVAHLKRCTGGQFELKHDMTDVTPLKSLHSAETEGTKAGSKKTSKRQTDRARGRERDDKVRSLSAGAVE